MAKIRPTRPVQLVSDAGQNLITFSGRPKDERRPTNWTYVVLRLLGLAWGGAVSVALLDEFGLATHLPFVLAMGMTAVLVLAAFLLTRGADEQPADPRQRRPDQVEDDPRDLLTDLPTLNHFMRRLDDEFSRVRRIGLSMAVVLIDVNNLTAVNKEYGVRAGDEVLRHVAKVIDATRRFNDVAARLGDDEFGVLLLSTADEGVHAFIQRLDDSLARDSAVAEVAGRSISLWAGVCSGSAVTDPAMFRPEQVLEAAMASLNQAKQERERRRRLWLSA
ncbi:MAG: GGDEF domain-containing protein [Chloroflexota bacterium]|nr:GGDEF domain-containing protein [Chloroflexota bacterium]